MTTFLLDVNVLLALNNPEHVHHAKALAWFEGMGREHWATSPITENGFVRITSHPNYPNSPGDVAAVLAILHRLREAPGHEFWTEDVSIADVLEPGALITHAQTTDVYLLALAVHKGGKLATLDRRLPADAVRGGREALELIAT